MSSEGSIQSLGVPVAPVLTNNQEFRVHGIPDLSFVLRAILFGTDDWCVPERSIKNKYREYIEPDYIDVINPRYPGVSWPLKPYPDRRAFDDIYLNLIPAGSQGNDPIRGTRQDSPGDGSPHGHRDPHGQENPHDDKGGSGNQGSTKSDKPSHNGHTHTVLENMNSHRLNATVQVQPLIQLPAIFSKPWIGSFFIAPIYPKDGELSSEQTFWKVFHVCTPNNEEWDPHLIKESSHAVLDGKMANQFISLFGPILISTSRSFFRALRKGRETPGENPVLMSEYDREISYLFNELDIESDSQITIGTQIEEYLERTINVLETSFELTVKSTNNQLYNLTKNDIELLTSYLNERPPMEMEVDQSDEDGMFPDPNSFGRTNICYHHYRVLYPSLQKDYVEMQVPHIDEASYDVHTGRLHATITSQDQLNAFCELDQAKIGFVAEFDVELRASSEWKPSIADTNQLHNFAKQLKIDFMTIVSGNAKYTADIKDRDETSSVRELLKQAVRNFKRVDIIWDSDLDISALIKEASEENEDYVRLSIRVGGQQVSADIIDDTIMVKHIKSTLENLPRVLGSAFLPEEVYNLEISNVLSTNQPEQVTQIVQMIQKSNDFTSLVLNCASTSASFKKTLKSMQDNNGSSFIKNLFLTNSTANDTVAHFDIYKQPSIQHVMPLALDVTVRELPAPISLLKSYGGAIRVLNILHSSADAFKILDEVSSKNPGGLKSLTLLLKGIQSTHVDSMIKILESSKEKFTQLTLLSGPKDEKVKGKLLEILEKLQRCQVLLAQTKEPGIHDWIAEVTSKIDKTNVLTIIKSVDEMKTRVPGFSKESVSLLNRIFDSTEDFSLSPSHQGPVVLHPQDHKKKQVVTE